MAASSSYTWRSIFFGYKALEERLIWRIGNGKAASFWKDKWLEDAPLASCVVRPLDQAELGKSIHDHWLQTNDWDWGVLRQYLPDAILSKLSGILALGHSETQDKLLWKHSSKGEFSINSVYSQLLQGAGFAVDKGWKAFWRFKGPTRASFTLWLVRHNRLKTDGLLFTRNVHKDGVCVVISLIVCSMLCETVHGQGRFGVVFLGKSTGKLSFPVYLHRTG